MDIYGRIHLLMSRGGEEPVNIYGISAEDAETLKVIICKIEHNATLE